MFWVHRWIRNFFGFSRSQTNAFIILLPLLALIIFSAPAYRWWISHRPRDFSKDKQTLDSLITLWDTNADTTIMRQADPLAASTFFAFDPNEISEADFQRLGFSKNLSTRITHYRQKGGKFRVKADLLRIYGMDSALYAQLIPFIRLPEKLDKPGEVRTRATVHKAERKLFDLNRADTAQFKAIYGIGEKLSLRIVRYRDVLGGFVNMEQLSEVYGLDSIVVNKLMNASFIEENFQPRRVYINKSTEKELAVHPYLKGTAARAIVAYRFQHGEFRSVDDLQNIQSIDAETIRKIAPYLEFGN